jgi:2-dehydro-3-deoxygluconokinase
MTGDGGAVYIVGEPLLELSSDEPLETARTFTLSFSGDALNAAAASAAAGARTELLSRVGEDEIGDRLLGYAERLGVGVTGVRRGTEPTGAYLVGADPHGVKDFAYLRSASAATRMTPADLAGSGVERAAVLVISGIAMAASQSLADTVVGAARLVHEADGLVVYDPNHRSRIASADQAPEHLSRLLPSVSVVVPSAPTDTVALVDTADPVTAAQRLHELGCDRVVVTCGEHGAYLCIRGQDAVHVPAAPAPQVLDSTGAGDVFVGTLAAGLTRGPLAVELVRTAAAAAALSLAGRGGTGHLAAQSLPE